MPSELTTSEVVRLLDNKKFHKDALRRDEWVQRLLRKNHSKGNKPYYKFSTIKVLELKTEIDEN